MAGVAGSAALMIPLGFWFRRFGRAATCACMLAGTAGSGAAQDGTGLETARRVADVQALRPENEEKLSESALLALLGRTQYSIERGQPESGRIEIAFTDEQGGALSLNGWISYDTDDGKNKGCIVIYLGSGIATVEEGRATIVLRGRERRAIVHTEGLPGFALAKKDRFGRKDSFVTLMLLEGEAVSRVELPLEPAGAIRWRVLDEEGKPETKRVKYRLYTPPSMTRSGDIDPPFQAFFIRPARFGAPYRLVLQKGARFADSSLEALSGEAPVADLAIAFQPGKTISGRLLSADGAPLNGKKLRLGYQELEPQPTMLEDVATTLTGPEGEFSFDSINLDIPNRYWIVFEPSDESREARRALPKHRIAVDSKTPLPVEMRLPEVHAARGRLLDAKTGAPIVGVNVSALMHERFSATGRPNWLPVFKVPAAAATDENGSFQFHNLPAGVYDFSLSEGRVAQHRSEVTAASGNLLLQETDIDLLPVPEQAAAGLPTFWVRD